MATLRINKRDATKTILNKNMDLKNELDKISNFKRGNLSPNLAPREAQHRGKG